jgi:hypothetical protein
MMRMITRRRRRIANDSMMQNTQEDEESSIQSHSLPQRRYRYHPLVKVQHCIHLIQQHHDARSTTSTTPSKTGHHYPHFIYNALNDHILMIQ